ncbi:MAG: BREX-1 system adenine-specific DNA-methyltransferase PglX [Bacteroidales bacterium]|nr:BREX-1 system adenine-specific DNA-methyltransferase PglX [Bacteroidales bacterium]
MNTNALKTFAQQARLKLISQVSTKLNFALNEDTAYLRGMAQQVKALRDRVQRESRDKVVEEVAYTWFNRVMALRFMDANGFNSPMVVTPLNGGNRPEILQDAISGVVNEDLRLSADDLSLPEGELYRKLLVATCNHLGEKMPFLFELIADYTELLLPDDLLSKESFVTEIRNNMTDEDCQDVEIMGWLYQFYITDRKNDAEGKKSKKGGLKSDEQAAATQLFTPHWIVRYMVENSLGRIWMTLHPESSLINEMKYYIPSPEGQADTIPDHIREAKDITMLDPCMGSGHILVYAFDLLAKMYEEEGYQPREIPALILTHNLYGMDIDERCKQLAAFALTMKAVKYYSRYLRREAVQPNVIALKKIERDVIAAAGNWEPKSDMWQFENIDTIGSLLKVSPEDAAAIKVETGLFGEASQLLKTQAEYLVRKYDCVVTNPPYLGKGFGNELKDYAVKEYPNSKSDTCTMFVERLSNFVGDNCRYAFIIPPSWMFLSGFEDLRTHIFENQSIETLLHLSRGVFGADFGSSSAVIINHKDEYSCGTYFRLIERTFQEFDENHLRILFLKTLENPNFRYKFINYSKDVDDIVHSEDGAKIYYPSVPQSNFSKIPGSPIGYWVSEKFIVNFKNKTLKELAEPKAGLATGDNNKFQRFWYEVDTNQIGRNYKSVQETITGTHKWFPCLSGGRSRKWADYIEYIVNWQFDGKELKSFRNKAGNLAARPQNTRFYFKPGMTWNKISSNHFLVKYNRGGSIYDDTSRCAFLKDESKILYYVGLLCSKVSEHYLKFFNPTMSFTNGDISRLPIIIEEDLYIDSIVQINLSISQLDWNAHETSWDFQQSPLLERMSDCGQNGADLDMLDPEEIEEIKATCNVPTNSKLLSDVVLAYKHHWERQFRKLHRNEEELNRRFIEIYGLENELSPDVPLDEITILQKGEISIKDGRLVWHDDVIIKQFISYLVGCFMGRYSVDKPGLIIASQHQDLAALGLEVDGIDNGITSTIAIDDDCIVPIVEEMDFFPDDMAQRVELAIRRIFGNENHHANMRFIEKCLGTSLRSYLYKDFYADHQQMYQRRPIYWLFSSKMGDKKKKGYFKAYVYMHRIEPDTLSKLHADYVHPYIEKIRRQLAEAEDDAMRDDLNQAQRNKARSTAALLQDKVREVTAFERELVQLASHRISIDLDDGVRLNYPKFYPLTDPIKGME